MTVCNRTHPSSDGIKEPLLCRRIIASIAALWVGMRWEDPADEDEENDASGGGRKRVGRGWAATTMMRGYWDEYAGGDGR